LLTEQYPSKFGSVEFYDRFLRYALHWEHHRQMQSFDNCFYYQSRNGIFVPTSSNRGFSLDISVCDAAIFCWIYENAEIMRWTLTDESIPLEDKRKVFGIFDGGRRSNAIALGMLKYWPALPQFREVVLYETDGYLRELCVYAMGELSENAYAYREDIQQAIKSTDDEYFQIEAVDALAKLDDKMAVPLFCRLFEKMVCRIKQHSFEEMFEGKNASMLMLMERILQALIKLDISTARELLSIGLSDGNPHVYRFCKRAFELSSDRSQLKLILSSKSAQIAFLPHDYYRRYQLRC